MLERGTDRRVLYAYTDNSIVAVLWQRERSQLVALNVIHDLGMSDRHTLNQMRETFDSSGLTSLGVTSVAVCFLKPETDCLSSVSESNTTRGNSPRPSRCVGPGGTNRLHIWIGTFVAIFDCVQCAYSRIKRGWMDISLATIPPWLIVSFLLDTRGSQCENAMPWSRNSTTLPRNVFWER